MSQFTYEGSEIFDTDMTRSVGTTKSVAKDRELFGFRRVRVRMRSFWCNENPFFESLRCEKVMC